MFPSTGLGRAPFALSLVGALGGASPGQVVFAPPEDLLPENPSSLAALEGLFADFNGDGQVDLAAPMGAFAHVLTLFLGDGAGGLSSIAPVNVGPANQLAPRCAPSGVGRPPPLGSAGRARWRVLGGRGLRLQTRCGEGEWHFVHASRV